MMSASSPQVLLLMCSICQGMTAKLLPEIRLHFSQQVRVFPITCPSQIDPFAFIKLLKNSVDGVIVACPKETCCCPENKKVLKRREIVKDILPVFGLHREQFHVASVSPFAGQELIAIIEHMLNFIKITFQNKDEYRFASPEEDVLSQCKWVN